MPLKELSRSGGIVKYRLYAKGLPHERNYSLLLARNAKGPERNVTGCDA